MTEIKLDYDRMNGFGLRPSKEGSTFIPFKGWAGYEQSDMLEEWTDSVRSSVKFKTGLDFPKGTKGFPIELLFWLWRDHEFFLEDFFDTSVTNKLEIAAKDVLKTGFQTMSGIFLMTNFDFAENMSMTKYQNQLYQVPGAVAGYLDFIAEETGLRLHTLFQIPDKLDDRAANIHFTRKWYKTRTKRTTNSKGKETVKKVKELVVTREWLLRSFDKPHKITNTPKRRRNGAIVWVNIIEPVMFNDIGDISAKEMQETWSVNKSSIFRYARDIGIYAQMSSDMNNWDPEHDFPAIAQEILPFDLYKMQEQKTMVAVSIVLNFRVRRLTRFANTFRKMTDDELVDYDKEGKENNNLWLAKYWGAPYSMFGETPFTYLYSMKHIEYLNTPSTDDMKKIDHEDTNNANGYILDLGIDFGTNHATTLKASHWIPSLGTLHREHVARICNYEIKKDGLEPYPTDVILNIMFDAVIEYTLPLIESGAKTKVIVYWDQGSWSTGEIFQSMFISKGLGDVIIVMPGLIHKEHGRKAKTSFDNYVHAYGLVSYDPNNEITVDQYKKTKNKKRDWETREENNQILDEIDATNIAETHIRPNILLWLSKRRKEMGNLNG